MREVVKATVPKEDRAAVIAHAVERLTRLNLPPLYKV